MPISLCVPTCVSALLLFGAALFVCARAGPNCLLECRKEGASGWESYSFSLVHTTDARLNEMLGFVASFPPRPNGSLLPQILVECNFLPFQIRSGS